MKLGLKKIVIDLASSNKHKALTVELSFNSIDSMSHWKQNGWGSKLQKSIQNLDLVKELKYLAIKHSKYNKGVQWLDIRTPALISTVTLFTGSILTTSVWQFGPSFYLFCQ